MVVRWAVLRVGTLVVVKVELLVVGLVVEMVAVSVDLWGF